MYPQPFNFKYIDIHTRLLLLIGILIFIWNPCIGVVLLFTSIIINIINRQKMKESKMKESKIKESFIMPQNPACGAMKPLLYDVLPVSQNTSTQKMDANPRTKISPIVAAPSHDINYWKRNDTIRHSNTNYETNTDLYLSGYATRGCQKCEVPQYGETINPIIENFIENFEVSKPYDIQQSPKPNQSGWVNTACGYNQNQLSNNLPSNYTSGTCQLSPSLQEYNKNLFTQMYQPFRYNKTDIINPVSENMGISFTQQFEPMTSSVTQNGGLLFTEQDPRMYTPQSSQRENMSAINSINTSNVYDPRFTGYGPSTRAYTHNMLGQTRFMYDDINAVRMPNYLVRSHIDTQKFADTYGSVEEGNEYGNKNTHAIRALVQDAWTDNSIQFRDDITTTAMRKNNAVRWQRRMAPIY